MTHQERTLKAQGMKTLNQGCQAAKGRTHSPWGTRLILQKRKITGFTYEALWIHRLSCNKLKRADRII